MKNNFLHIIVRAWSLFVATSTTWDVIASENESQLTLRKRYVFPWVILCMLTVLVFDGVYATENWFEIGFLNAIIMPFRMVEVIFFQIQFVFGIFANSKLKLAQQGHAKQ
jgi:membrane-associated HD superfamily phosphohydrolase